MDEDKIAQAFREQQLIKDEAMAHSMHQLAFGATVASENALNISTLATTAATNLYATATAGVVSAKTYYKKAVVDNAALFMDNNLKILATSPYVKSLNNMHKIDDMSAISSRYAITEYFNVIYYDILLTPGSKCNYAINDTKNAVKHLNFLRQSFENIVQHKGLFPIGIIASKLENLHKALI